MTRINTGITVAAEAASSQKRARTVSKNSMGRRAGSAGNGLVNINIQRA
jgi:hypothetical protein